MESKTFKNLTEERRQEIIAISCFEFAMYDYQNASLSRIIRKLNIAKGSFYRYFASKKDLYFFLLDYISKLRLKTSEDIFGDKNNTLYDILIKNFKEKLAFDQAYPLFGGFLYRVQREKYHPDLGNMEDNLKKQITVLTKQIINQPHILKNLRADIDSDFLAYLVIQNQLGIYDYLSMQFGDDLINNIREGKPFFETREEEVLKMIEQFTLVLKSGIEKQV